MSSQSIHKIYMEAVEGDIADIDKVPATDIELRDDTNGADETVPDQGQDAGNDKYYTPQDNKALDEFEKDADVATEEVCNAFNEVRSFERALEKVGAYVASGAWTEEQGFMKVDELMKIAMPIDLESADISLEGAGGIFKQIGEKFANSFRIMLAAEASGVAGYDVYKNFKGTLAEVWKTDFPQTHEYMFPQITKMVPNAASIDKVQKELVSLQNVVVGKLIKTAEAIMKAEDAKAADAIALKTLEDLRKDFNKLTILDTTKSPDSTWYTNKEIKAAEDRVYGKWNKSRPLGDVIKNVEDFHIVSPSYVIKMNKQFSTWSESYTKACSALELGLSKAYDKDTKQVGKKGRIISALNSRMLMALQYVAIRTRYYATNVITCHQFAVKSVLAANANTLAPEKLQKLRDKISQWKVRTMSKLVNKKSIHTSATNAPQSKFDVDLNSAAPEEVEETQAMFGFLDVSDIAVEDVAPGTPTNTEKPAEISDPSDKLLAKITENANNNDQLDAQSRKSIEAELKKQGFISDDNGGENADELEPKSAAMLSDENIGKIEKITTESALDIELESMDMDFSMEGTSDAKTTYKKALADAKEVAKKENDALNAKLKKDLDALEAKKSEMTKQDYKKAKNQINEDSVVPFNEIVKKWNDAKKAAKEAYKASK